MFRRRSGARGAGCCTTTSCRSRRCGSGERAFAAVAMVTDTLWVGLGLLGDCASACDGIRPLFDGDFGWLASSEAGE